ncbi:Apm4p NDAI_0G02920 [Naumovozyma dairenensis CBS 421]|uniref:MHD domain-containing protein n=1 Tax=Naumovozyma dairenensis (strain ATCC 10597 / BCRC 20456 / CBS 421 / NBRC 0211 / NRRL Y-12639) TaxID=1071378 RepID=G0WE58_NAUDC|nr:hypothetical protein NDAI_0G02920 [Naumovozyma dairenensis CBS 421]CCD26069.2 hypothetical protein NDAI_0G02920 [Naumovozyma dairenensis CBS 421]
MINGILIYSPRGELIVSKLFKGTLKRSIADIFRIQVINNLDVRSPILTLGSTTFHHIRSSKDSDNLWLVAATRNNANSAAIWEFLYKLDSMLIEYGLNKEEYLKEEFMIVHELLDVMLGSCGIPLETEPSKVIAKMSVKPAKLHHNNTSSLLDGHLGSKGNNEISMPKFLKRNDSSQSHDSNFSFNDFSWRPKDIKHKKNEVILHVNEKINILVAKDGSILKAYVDGSIDLQTRLSGTPVCQFGLNDSLTLGSNDSEYSSRNGRTGNNKSSMLDSNLSNKVLSKASVGNVILEDCKFHQCVSLDKFDRERIIKFVPPDGSVELMKYHIRNNLNLPFKITPIVTNSVTGDALDYRIALKSLFPGRLSAKGVVLHIPVPPGVMDCNISVSNGTCKFVPAENAMVWKFNKYNGLTENTLSAVTVPSKEVNQTTLQQWARPPMSLDFEILMFSNSGLVVRYFTISEGHQNYKAVKWIKYVSKSGSYEVRF